MRAALRRKPPVKGEPVRRAVERKPGLVVAHFNAQCLDFRALDVGRIRRDDIEALRNLRKEIRAPERKRQPRSRTVDLRDRERIRRDVRAECRMKPAEL